MMIMIQMIISIIPKLMTIRSVLAGCWEGLCLVCTLRWTPLVIHTWWWWWWWGWWWWLWLLWWLTRQNSGPSLQRAPATRNRNIILLLFLVLVILILILIDIVSTNLSFSSGASLSAKHLIHSTHHLVMMMVMLILISIMMVMVMLTSMMLIMLMLVISMIMVMLMFSHPLHLSKLNRAIAVNVIPARRLDGRFEYRGTFLSLMWLLDPWTWGKEANLTCGKPSSVFLQENPWRSHEEQAWTPCKQNTLRVSHFECLWRTNTTIHHIQMKTNIHRLFCYHLLVVNTHHHLCCVWSSPKIDSSAVVGVKCSEDVLAEVVRVATADDDEN